MTLLRFLLLAYGLVAIFIAGGLFFKKSGLTYQTLSLFTLLFGLEILDFLYSTSSMAIEYPYFYGRYYFAVGFLYGPILYLHFNALLYERSFHRIDLLHFLPLVIFLVTAADILVMPDVSRMEYIHTHFLDRIMPYNYARAFHILGYGVWFIIMIRDRYNDITTRKRLFSIFFCVIYFITAVLVSWLTAFAENWRSFIYYYLITSSIVFITGYILYRDPGFLKTIRQKYLRSSLNQNDMDRILKKIESVFEEKQLYLNSDLNMSVLGKSIKEQPADISQTLSTLVRQNFNNFVNDYRVEHALALMKDHSFDHYKIEGIAMESGFNNKVTFYKAFKKRTGQTPSSFRSRLS